MAKLKNLKTLRKPERKDFKIWRMPMPRQKLISKRNKRRPN
jgi:agmatine/peptidylarginine deiminase